jgi:hypothetical protein
MTTFCGVIATPGRPLAQGGRSGGKQSRWLRPGIECQIRSTRSMRGHKSRAVGGFWLHYFGAGQPGDFVGAARDAFARLPMADDRDQGVVLADAACPITADRVDDRYHGCYVW